MNRILRLALVGLLAAGSAASGLFADARADEIIKASLDQKAPNDNIGTSTMTITDRSGVVKVRKLKQVSKETAEGTKAYVEFVEPADVNGTKFLTVSKKGAETDQRLYLPALKKIRKISSSSKDAEFLGSDLCYFDMEKRYFEDGVYTLLAEGETLPESAFAGMKFAKISTTFKAANAPYSKTVTWVNLADYIPYKTECYDKKDGGLLKTITIDEVKIIKGYALPTKTTIVNHKKGSKTEMTLADIAVDTGVKDSEVSLKRLEQ
jgi:outer membrane lipoprotein-sorting protein